MITLAHERLEGREGGLGGDGVHAVGAESIGRVVHHRVEVVVPAVGAAGHVEVVVARAAAAAILADVGEGDDDECVAIVARLLVLNTQRVHELVAHDEPKVPAEDLDRALTRARPTDAGTVPIVILNVDERFLARARPEGDVADRFQFVHRGSHRGLFTRGDVGVELKGNNAVRPEVGLPMGTVCEGRVRVGGAVTRQPRGHIRREALGCPPIPMLGRHLWPFGWGRNNCLRGRNKRQGQKGDEPRNGSTAAGDECEGWHTCELRKANSVK